MADRDMPVLGVPGADEPRDPHPVARRHRNDEPALDTELDAEQREFVEIMRNSGEALLLITNEVLDFSKIESGVIELDNRLFELREYVECALTFFALPSGNKGVKLIARLAAGCPSAPP